MLDRPPEVIRAELMHVMWVLEEAPRWDISSVGAAARNYLVERYRKQEWLLRTALKSPARVEPVVAAAQRSSPAEVAGAPTPTPAVLAAASASPREVTPSAARPPPAAAPEAPPVAPQVPAAVPEAPAAPSRPRREQARGARAGSAHRAPASPGPVAALLDAEERSPSPEDQVVEEASSWSRVWKPFLTESVGWFIGAFLILAGTLYWVADAWQSMTTSQQALTVFGLAATWTLGFAAWARFLDRREVTPSAGRVVKLIAAAIAPLAPVALGPVMLDQPLLAAPALLAWSLCAFALGRAVTRDYDALGLRWTPVAMLLTTAMMGLAPVFAAGGTSAFWLTALPVGALALSARKGPRESGTATAFAALAPLYLLGLFSVRLHIALELAQALPPPATWAPFVAAAAGAALWLRRPRQGRAADVLAVGVVVLQVAMLALSVLGEAPAFFVSAALLGASGLHLSRERLGPNSPRWLVAAWVGSYFAFQACGQLVPGVLKHLIAQLRVALGYGGSELPASYDAVYAAVFVVAVAVLAARELKARRWFTQSEAQVLLTCTAYASAFVGLLGLASIASDVRPALWSAPVVSALCLSLGVSLQRRLLTWVGAGLSLVVAAALAVALPLAWGSLAVAALALALAAASVVLLQAHRQPLQLAATAVALGAVGLSWAAPAGAVSVLALAIGALALLLLARESGSAEALALAWFVPALLPVRVLMALAPELMFVALAAGALVLALLARLPGRWASTSAAAAGAALLAPVLQLALQATGEPSWLGPCLGPVLVLSALSLLVAREGWRDAVALVMVAGCALPLRGELCAWSDLTPMMSAALALTAALGASLWSARFERSWRPALIASLALLVAVVSVTMGGFSQPLLVLAALTALVSSRALLPSVSVPLAAMLSLGASELDPLALLVLAAAFSAVALFEEFDVTWSHLLGRRAVAWAASLSAMGLLLVPLLTRQFDVFTSSVALGLVLVGLALVWVRATRWPGFGALVPAGLLLAEAELRGSSLGNAFAVWLALAAVAMVALTRALKHPAVARQVVGPTRTARTSMWLRGVMVAAWAALGLWLQAGGHGSPLPFAAALLFAAAEPVAPRVVLAAFFAALVPGAAGLAAVGLLALGYAARHLPRTVELLLGSRNRSWLEGSAALSAVSCAVWQATVDPFALSSGLLLAGCLAACALLMGWRWLLGVAVVALAFPLSMLVPGALTGAAVESHAMLAAVALLGAGALAAGLRSASVADAASRWGARLGSGWDGALALPVWVGAAAGLAALLGLSVVTGAVLPVPLVLLAAALLLITPELVEGGLAAAVLTLTVVVVAPDELRAAAVAALGLVLCAGGAAMESRQTVGRVFHHAGWVACLLSLAMLPGLHQVATPLTFVLAAGAAVVVANRRPSMEWTAWVAGLVAAHVGLFHAGLVLSTGQPMQLIAPWAAAVSLVLGSVALLAPATSQRRAVGVVAVVLGLFELAFGVLSLDGAFPREAVVAVVGCAVALGALAKVAVDDDDPVAGALLQMCFAAAVIAGRWLGAHQAPGVPEALVALVTGAVLGGAAKRLDASSLPRLASAAKLGAFAWPVVGLVAAPFDAPWLVSVLLLTQALHFGALSRLGVMRRRMAFASTAAFNAALVFGYLATGWSGPQYLLVPAGLSALVLLHVFRLDLEPETSARLRAVAVTVIYASAAWKPLAFDDPMALFACALVCVLGVAAGITTRVRSVVLLGTGFLVTTVVASLVRYGIHEPRVGALLLSALGLLIVGFMVVVTTRRAEVLQRYQAARSMLQQWQA